MTGAAGVDLHMETVTGAAALPVVMVHGYLGGSAQWSDLQAALSDRFSIVALDLPGFGRASGHAAPATIAGFAEHVIADLDARGIERCVLVGHSMGGMIAQEVARKIPQRLDRLVLYGTGPLGSMPERFEPLDVSLDRLQQDGVAKTARRIAATWLLHGDAHPGFEALSRIGAQADGEAARIALNAMATWDGRASLSLLTMPSLIIWGDEDRSYRWRQVEYLWTHLPAASLAVIPGASHAAHVEKPELFRMILEDFLTG
ncbi:MAG: putative hydrolases or acyltransferases (alpha/beta hydrolase superfamily) [Rhodobacteraceae bacterium HLUCCO18]|nr:MAG: putative hydrolases or acyltransferases (alpha/beta hydrolase superfamily) [Rhodobacteraceae bacterium HLUCCO18]